MQLLYSEVIDRYGTRDPARPRWIHLTRDSVTPQWQARGPLALSEIVERGWGNSEGLRIQLGAQPFSGEPTSAALARLILHLSPRMVTEADDVDKWRSHSLGLCAGTLGISTEPPYITCIPIMSTSSQPPREEVSEQEFSMMLSKKMNDNVWEAYINAVAKHLSEDDIGSDLRPAMQKVWAVWNAVLNKSAPHQASFVRAMLATAEEWSRKGFDSSVRAGRLLIEDLARASLTALAIAATLEAGGIPANLGPDGSAENLHFGSVSAHIIALAAASHPSDRKPCRFSDAPGAMFLAETGITILGVVDASASDLYRLACGETVPFSASDAASQNYRHPGQPFPLLTAGPLFREALRTGLTAMRQHLAEALGLMDDDRAKGLREAIERATIYG